MGAALAFSVDTVAARTGVGAVESDSLSIEPYTLRTYDGVEHPAEILTFRVPENRRHPSGRYIHLRCVRLRSTSSSPKPPIVFLSGGPGIPATGLAQVPVYYGLFERLRGVSDVLLLDQRGMGASASAVPPAIASISPEVFTSSKRLLEAMGQSLAASVGAHRRAGVEVLGYTTGANAELSDRRSDLGRLDPDPLRRARAALRAARSSKRPFDSAAPDAAARIRRW